MSQNPDKPRSAPPPVPSRAPPSTSEDEDGIEVIPAEPLPSVSLEDPRIGHVLSGRYRLDKLVGKGGMGRVYRATQFPLNRPVAVKILNPEFQKKDPQFVRRFFLEAASAARLSHPNTITVFDYGESESGELFIVMEFLKGKPLSKIISTEGALNGERVLHIGMQICRALREAHARGIIHRDLKPGNILLLEEGDDADFVKVLDFGLVKLFTPAGETAPTEEPLTPSPVESELTKAGMFLGSPKYMSPEQIQGLPLDPRTDIYSLGVLMFQMATGKPPYSGTTSVEVIYKHVNQPIPTFAEHGVAGAPELEALVHKCLEKRREDRFDSMAALLARMKDVRRLVTGISSASETGVDIDPSDISSLVKKSGRNAPPTVSQRPRIHGPPTGERPVAPKAKPQVREASFAESTGEDSGVALKRSATTRGPKLTTIAPVIAGSALVVMLGVLAYVMSAPRGANNVPTSVEPEDPALVAPKTAKVKLESTPAGAEVWDRGVKLGQTPLSVELPAAGVAHDFVFKKKGFYDAVESKVISKGPIAIKATLRVDASPPPPEGQGREEDYKENPY